VRNEKVLENIRTLKTEHPFWGYRKVWAYLNFRQHILVNKKRVYRLMQEHELMVPKNMQLRAVRTTGYRQKPRATCLNQIWGIDMTKVKIGAFGWLYLVVVLDWYSKKIVGYSISYRSKARDWLDALNMAVNQQFPEGIREHKEQLHLVSDNGCQPTSETFMRESAGLGIRQIFASFNNPKGNADTERVMRTLKEEIVWPYDWQIPQEFEAAFAAEVVRYNTDYPHSAIGYLTPQQCEDISKSRTTHIQDADILNFSAVA
jgi:putative transposase